MATNTPGAVTPIAAGSPFATNPAYSGTFIPTIWSSKLNVKFYATTVFSEIANTDYEGEISKQGDKVVINNVPDITISDYQIGQTLNYQVPVGNKIELNLDQAKYFGVSVSDVLEYQSQPRLMDMFTTDAAKQMATAIDRDILLKSFNTGAAANKGSTAGIRSTSYNFGTDNVPVVLTGANVVTLLTGLASALDEQNVPGTDRFLVVTPYVRQVLMASPLAQTFVTGDSVSMLRNGKIGEIDRFTIYVSNLLPTAAAGRDFFNVVQAGAAKRQAIIAGHKSAITFASQITKTEELANYGDFGRIVRGLNVYGYSTIKPEALCLALVA